MRGGRAGVARSTSRLGDGRIPSLHSISDRAPRLVSGIGRIMKDQKKNREPGVILLKNLAPRQEVTGGKGKLIFGQPVEARGEVDPMTGGENINHTEKST